MLLSECSMSRTLLLGPGQPLPPTTLPPIGPLKSDTLLLILRSTQLSKAKSTPIPSKSLRILLASLQYCRMQVLSGLHLIRTSLDTLWVISKAAELIWALFMWAGSLDSNYRCTLEKYQTLECLRLRSHRTSGHRLRAVAITMGNRWGSEEIMQDCNLTTVLNDIFISQADSVWHSNKLAGLGEMSDRDWGSSLGNI